MVKQSSERRAFGRIDIKTAAEYRLEGQSAEHKCMLDNMSANGLLLWTEQSIPLGDKVLITIRSDSPDEPPIELTAIVIRVSEEPAAEAGFGYGCQIEAVVDA